MEEHIFLNENDVLVSSTRFVIDNTDTYTINGIVFLRHQKGEKKVRYINLIVGLLFIAAALVALTAYTMNALLWGGFSVAIVLGIILLVTSVKKIPHLIEFRIAGGEVEVFSDKDGDFVKKVYNAVNEAIVFRG